MSALDNETAKPPPTLAHRLPFWLTAIVALAIVCASPTAATATSEHQAGDAAAFVDSIGVNTHILYTGTPYYDRLDLVKQRLVELGVHHIREDLGVERPDQYERLNALAAAGIKSTLILGDPHNGSAGLDERIATIRDHLSGAIDAVEGPNEYSTRGGAGWREDLAAYQQQLYAAIKGNSALAGLPVIGPSIVHGDQAALGDVSSSLDFGNMHSYPNGGMPEANLGFQLGQAALNSGSKPVMATETGYNTAVSSESELKPASEAAMATYTPRLFLDYFAGGVTRTFSYELLDEAPDPGLTDPEAHFGLLRNDLSPKPAFDALRNLIEILSDSGAGLTPEPLEYTIDNPPSDLHQVLLQKSDGSYYLALWRAESVWDPTTRTPLSAPSSPVTLRFSRRIEDAQRYLPTDSSSPSGIASSSGNSLTLKVGPQVTILRLDVGGSAPAAAGRIHLWVSRRSVPAGGRVAIGGRLPRKVAGRPRPVNIQRWQPAGRHWRTVGHGRTTARGAFRKAFRFSPRRFGRVSRLRVVAPRVQPSKPLRIRLRGSGRRARLGLAARVAVAPRPSPGVDG